MTAAWRQAQVDHTGLPLLVFVLDDQRYALPLSSVQRALRVVAITPIPAAPRVVLGIVDVAGVVMPVIDARRRFGHPPREIRLSDHLVVADTGRRTVAFLVDEAAGVVEASPDDIEPPGAGLPGLELVEGSLKMEDGLILILGRLLSPHEEAELDRALGAASPRTASRGPSSPAARPKSAARRKRSLP